MNLPAGMTIITGQPFAHSLKSEPGVAACAFSCSTESRVAFMAVRQRSCPTTSCAMVRGSIRPRLTKQSMTMRPATSTLPRHPRSANVPAAIATNSAKSLSSALYRSVIFLLLAGVRIAYPPRLRTGHRSGSTYALVEWNVRIGSKADMCSASTDVCFTPESDIERVLAHVRFVPIADIMYDCTC